MGIIRMGVGLYSCRTADHDRGINYIHDSGTAEIDGIILDLDTQIKRLSDHIRAAGIPGFGVQGIFIAPEYLFSAGNGTASMRGVPDFIKTRIIEKLTQLSLKYRNIIIIPGSICWYTSALGSGVANLSMGGTLSAKQASQPLPVSQAKVAWQNKSISGNVGFHKDTGTAKIGAHQAKKVTGEHVQSKFQKNTLPVLHNGKIVSEYHKSSDFNESNIDNIFHVPEPHPGLITVNTHQGKLTMGLEVCLDHACEVLFNWLTSSTGNQQPHLHIISSASVNTNYYICKNNGWLLHASSDPQETLILHHGHPADQKSLTNHGLLLDVIEVNI